MGEGIAETSQLERKLDTGHDILRLSSHRMCAFSAVRDLVPSPTAQPLRADALADPSFGRLIAICGHVMNLRQAPDLTHISNSKYNK